MILRYRASYGAFLQNVTQLRLGFLEQRGSLQKTKLSARKNTQSMHPKNGSDAVGKEREGSLCKDDCMIIQRKADHDMKRQTSNPLLRKSLHVFSARPDTML